MIINELWIDITVFDVFCYSENLNNTDREKLLRPYDMWEHAKYILEKYDDSLHKVDSISTLKRCLNQRLQFIEKIYKLNSIKLKDSPSGYLEYLELVRPLIPKKLMRMRNDIEHNDNEPPSMERCLELLDLTWYFLKTTDEIVKYERNTFHFDIEDDKYFVQLDFDYENNECLIWGWIPPVLKKNEQYENSYKIQLKEIKFAKEVKKKHNFHKDKNDEDLFIKGKIELPNKIKQRILLQAFKEFP